MEKFCWVYGVHAVKSVLINKPERTLELFVQDNRQDEVVEELIELAKKAGASCQRASKNTLNKKTKGDAVHQGLLLKIRPDRILKESDLLEMVTEDSFFLVLDSVTDPHNLGACLRVADAAGVDAVIIMRNNAAPLTPLVRKIASGAADSVDLITVNNLPRALRKLKEMGVSILGTALTENSSPLNEIIQSKPMAVVMGAEGQGLSEKVMVECEKLVELPMQGYVNSLNISVATGIVLYALAGLN